MWSSWSVGVKLTAEGCVEGELLSDRGCSASRADSGGVPSGDRVRTAAVASRKRLVVGLYIPSVANRFEFNRAKSESAGRVNAENLGMESYVMKKKERKIKWKD